MRYQILLLDIPDELHHALEHRFQGININFITVSTCRSATHLCAERPFHLAVLHFSEIALCNEFLIDLRHTSYAPAITVLDQYNVEYSDLLLRRKEIYEALHPETKHGGDRKSEKIKSAKCTFDSEKSFVDDTAEKLGVDPSTIRRQIQTAKNLTSEAKDIIRDTGTKITKKDALKLSRLGPEQQKDAASQLAAGEIKSMGEYHPAPAEPEEPPPPEPESPPAAPTVPSVPYSLGDKHYASIEESIADLKNPNKDCSYNPDTLLADIDGFVDTFHKNFAWYSDPFCTVVFPDISPVQFDFVRQRFATISSAMEDLLNLMERNMNK